MVHPQEDRNAEIMQERGPHPREAMGAPHGRLPDVNEIVGRAEPPYHPIGVDALSPLLLHIEFPATKDQLVAGIGHARIAVNQTTTRQVAEILDLVTPESFASSREVELAVERVWARVSEPQGRGGRHWQQDELPERARR